jgi:hypothetical protein
MNGMKEEKFNKNTKAEIWFRGRKNHQFMPLLFIAMHNRNCVCLPSAHKKGCNDWQLFIMHRSFEKIIHIRNEIKI